MTLNLSEQRQAFIDDIAHYRYIREDGRFILEEFCVYLSHCFGFDEKLHLSPQPVEMYRLLTKLIHERMGSEEASLKIQYQRIKDWQPEMAYIFPEQRMTCIHIGALTLVSHDWIYEIGHSLAGIPEPEVPSKYFAWADSVGYAVHAFIDSYHNALYAFQKKLDREHIATRGYSLFEALKLSYDRNIAYDEAIAQLKARHQAYQAALTQIARALENGYYLEAITLEECLISNCLFNFLKATGTKLSNPSFHRLLREISRNYDVAYDYPEQLIAELNTWRKARNIAIHGFITCAIQELEQSKKDFQETARTTGNKGAEVCKELVAWYELESVNFIRHEFPGTATHKIH